METIITIVILAVLLAVLGFVGFRTIRNRRSVTGTVTDKVFHPARTVTRSRRDHHRQHQHHHHPSHRRRSLGMGRMDRMDGMRVETRTIPDSWSVTITPDDGSSKVTRKVPQEQWDAISIGDDWSD